tara:strand:- start:29 stop:442 length:414 start_codon:yes stop_codon:yes gene_type:complete
LFKNASGDEISQVLDSPKTAKPFNRFLNLSESLFGSNEKLLFTHSYSVVTGQVFRLNSKKTKPKNKIIELDIIIKLWSIFSCLKNKKVVKIRYDTEPLLEPIKEIQNNEKQNNATIIKIELFLLMAINKFAIQIRVY